MVLARTQGATLATSANGTVAGSGRLATPHCPSTWARLAIAARSYWRDARGKNAMHEMTAEMAAKLFLAHEEALEHAAAKICRLLAQDAGLTPAECFVVCLR